MEGFLPKSLDDLDLMFRTSVNPDKKKAAEPSEKNAENGAEPSAAAAAEPAADEVTAAKESEKPEEIKKEEPAAPEEENGGQDNAETGADSDAGKTEAEEEAKPEKHKRHYDRIEKNVFVEELDDDDVTVPDFIDNYSADPAARQQKDEQGEDGEENGSGEGENGGENAEQKIVYVPSDQMQVKDSLLPKYKPAPMNKLPDIPFPEPENPDSTAIADMPISMPKEYGPIEPKRDYGKFFRRLLKAAVCVVMAATVVLFTAGAAFSAMKNDIGYWVFGKYVCSVEQTTVSPVLSKGDLVFVEPCKEESLKNGMAVVYLDNAKNFYRYAIITDGAGTKELILGIMDENAKVVTKPVASRYVIGIPSKFIPKAFTVIDFCKANLTIISIAAGLVILLGILLLILMKVRG